MMKDTQFESKREEASNKLKDRFSLGCNLPAFFFFKLILFLKEDGEISRLKETTETQLNAIYDAHTGTNGKMIRRQ